MSKLLNRAKRKLDNVNYHYARIADDDSHLEECCFNLQQGIELALKYLIEINGAQYVTNYSILAQLNILEKLKVEVPNVQNIRNIAPVLESWESRSRYGESVYTTVKQIDELKCECAKLIEFIESQVTSKEVQDMNAFPTNTEV